jgi:hypothetical protein
MAFVFSCAAMTASAAEPKKDAKKDELPPIKGPAVRTNPWGWQIHSVERPDPPVVTPGDKPSDPPSDAVVLFNGKDLAAWKSPEMKEVEDKKSKKMKKVPTGNWIGGAWKVENGYIECAPGTGYLTSKEAFGDCQLHIEFATPTPPQGESQGRGNSGVFFGEDYEVQVLDSYQNKTYADGSVGALYGQYPPYVNAAKKPGEWQVYDIIWRGPRFNDKGEVTRPAYVTVILNGVVVQDHSELIGPTHNRHRDPYKVEADKRPIRLQDHGNTTRFRNIWLRELPDDATLNR